MLSYVSSKYDLALDIHSRAEDDNTVHNPENDQTLAADVGKFVKSLVEANLFVGDQSSNSRHRNLT